jgi:hypothetical protein
MFYVKQSESTAARRRVPILMVDATDGSTPETGLTLYGLLSKNGNNFAATAGTFAEAGYGQYYYQFDTGEIDTLGFAGIHVTATGARNYDAIIHVTSYDAYTGGFISPGDVWSADISGIGTAGTAGSQLNLAAAGGGTTTGDIATAVWDYAGATVPATVKETLETASTQAGNAAGNTGSSTIRDAVWDTDVSYLTSPQAGAALYQAALGTTQNAPSEVWSYVTREITGGTATTVTNAVLVDPASMTGIAGTVWNTDVSAFLTPSAGYDLTQAASGGAGITAGDVWEYDISAITGAGTAGTQLNLAAAPSGAGITAGDVSNAVWNVATSSYTTSGTFGHNILRSDVAGTAGTVSLWTGGAYSGIFADTYRIDEDYNAAIALKDILTGIGASITGNITGDLSGSVGSVTADVNVSTASMSGIAGTVWNTDVSSFTSPSAGYDVHNGAGTAISASDVWNYTLTSSGQSADATLGNADDQATNAATNTNSPTLEANIWSYATRTITGGIVTSVGDKTGYSLSGTQAFNLTGSITGSVSGSVGSVTGSVGSVVNAVTVATASMSGIANTVWSTNISSYTSPSAGYSLYNATAGGGITAGDVWSYETRTVTGIGASALTSIADKVWRYQVVGFVPPYNAVEAGYVVGNIGNEVWSWDINQSAGAPDSAADYLLAAASGTTSNAPAQVWSYATRTITGGTANTVTNAVLVDPASMSGIANTVWSVDVSGYTSPSAGYDLSNATAGGGITAGDVWQYATRTITGGIADTVTTVVDGVTVTTNNDKTGYALSSTQTFDLTGNITGNLSGSVGSVTSDVPVDEAAISADVWSYVTRTLTSGSGISAYDVWNFDPTAMTVPQAGAILTDIQTDTNQIQTDISNVPNNVWSSDVSGYSTPGEAGFELSQASTGSGLTAGDVWSYVSRTLTSGGGVTAGDVWSYATRTTTGGVVDTNNDKTGYSLSGTQAFNVTGNITGNISGSVGSVTNPVSITTNAMSGTAGSVWNYVTRTLTSGSGLTAGDVWSYVLSNTDTAEANLVTAASGGAGITAGDVWTYATREITGGVIDTNNDKTDYALSTAGVNAVQSGLSTVTTAQVGQEVDASLLDVGLTSVVTGRIDAAVSSRLATSSYVTPPTTAAIATSVWTAATRTLTSGAGATAGDVWTYNISGITSSGSAAAQLNDASVSGSVVTIVNGPYRLTSIAEGVDGRIDILADSVQTIQLNCLDGFGAPFNITGYTTLVNVYDVSGALAETYTPTVDFSQNGIISFDIDTVITGTTGRYTSVVELTAGADVIQLGPLEILVRPL